MSATITVTNPTRKKLFNYAVIWHPTAEEFADGEQSELVIGPTTTLATDENEVKFIANREVPDEFAKEPGQLEVIVRPF